MKDDGEWTVVSQLAKDLAYGEHPIVVWKCDSRVAAIEKAVEMFKEALDIGDLSYELHNVRQELSGKNLACWCPIESPCHADVLFRIANGKAVTR